MNCYECATRGEAVAAVAVCKHCGVGMCLEHFRMAQDYRVGGTTYGCRHSVPSTPRGGKRERVPRTNGHLSQRLRTAVAGAS